MKDCSVFWMAFLFTAIHVHCQTNTEDFISIDCGLSSNSSYTDTTTKLTYLPDDQYIDTGKTYQIAKNYINNSLPSFDLTVRSFPTGDRNCYTFTNLTIGQKHLFRATFLYGNYDGTQAAKPNKPLKFDLYLGAIKWKTVTISDISTEYTFEAIGMVNANFTWICLINTGNGTPFISALELRPLKSILYPYVSNNVSIALHMRLNYGPTTNKIIRYPDDPYDRIWTPYSYDTKSWTMISTNTTNFSRNNDKFEVPVAVLSTAVVPIKSRNLSFIQWDSETGTNPPKYMSVRHFSELQKLSVNTTRGFDIYLNDDLTWSNYGPDYLFAGYIYNTGPISQSEHYKYTLVQNATSTLPPIINAFELYSVLDVLDTSTDPQDVNEIIAIKVQYNVKKNWAGDPCLPSQYIWYGISCTNISGGSTRITSVNMSYSGLTGTISDSFSSLQEIKYLDLSYNNLTGAIPESLATLSHLSVLNLQGNHFTGQVPDSLKKKAKQGLLTLIIDGECTNDCPNNGPSKKKSPKIVIIIVVIIITAVIFIAIMAAILLFCVKRQHQTGQQGGTTQVSTLSVHQNIEIPAQIIAQNCPEFPKSTLQFSYSELKKVTNNFTRQIGKGGFGNIYYGSLENGVEVAVKIIALAALQGKKQFLHEMRRLSQVQHKNIVSFIGYCNDRKNFGLVYEYMPQGSLHDHLRDNVSETLNWNKRLEIAIGVAQGLERLHAHFSIIHGDVKSGNILLDQNFQAKISDFGLSKMVIQENGNSDSMPFLGSPSYMDPQLQTTMTPRTKKSDVYSFGIVLLEIVTGQPPILSQRENIHIVEYVKQNLQNENIDEIVDSRFQNEYESMSMWKVVDLALMCTSNLYDQRPSMGHVVLELMEARSYEYR